MTKERAGRLRAFLPEVGEVIQQDGISGTRKSVMGRKSSGDFAGLYTLEEVSMHAQDSEFIRYQVTLERTFDGRTLSAAIINGEVTEVTGFGDSLSDEERMLYAKHLFHNFATCEEFNPPLIASE